MHFVNDLDGSTWAFTVTTIVLNAIVLVVCFANQPIKNTRFFGLSLGLAAICLVQVRYAYCPDASQPHLRLTGTLRPIHGYTYHSGKHDYTGVLVCVEPCSNESPLLELSHIASRLVNDERANLPTATVYLGRTENARIGNGQIMVAHPVVEVDDPTNGQQLYYRDTHRHWPRVIVLLLDTFVGILAFWLCIKSTEPRPESDVSGGSDTQGSDLVGLGLGADRNRS